MGYSFAMSVCNQTMTSKAKMSERDITGNFVFINLNEQIRTIILEILLQI